MVFWKFKDQLSTNKILEILLCFFWKIEGAVPKFPANKSNNTKILVRTSAAKWVNFYITVPLRELHLFWNYKRTYEKNPHTHTATHTSIVLFASHSPMWRKYHRSTAQNCRLLALDGQRNVNKQVFSAFLQGEGFQKKCCETVNKLT